MALMRLVVIEPDKPGSMDDHNRPYRRNTKGGRWPGLWAHVLPPTTMRGVLLWQDGRCQVVDSWDDFESYWDADDRIAGGAQVVFDDGTDWQYPILVANGFQFEEVVA
jgi:hypothetical protein